MSEWQPIETAPEDVWIILWHPEMTYPQIGRSHYVIGRGHDQKRMTHWHPLPSPPR